MTEENKAELEDGLPEDDDTAATSPTQEEVDLDPDDTEEEEAGKGNEEESVSNKEEASDEKEVELNSSRRRKVPLQKAPPWDKDDPFDTKIGTFQSLDHLRKLVNTTGSTIAYLHRIGKLLHGKYKIEKQASDRPRSDDYRLIDTTIDEGNEDSSGDGSDAENNESNNER